MRGRLALVVGGATLAGAAVYRVLTRRRVPVPPPDPRAADLKARLAESRSVVAEREEFEFAETPVDLAEPVSPELGDRRRTVHDRGRRVAEEMRRPKAP